MNKYLTPDFVFFFIYYYFYSDCNAARCDNFVFIFPLVEYIWAGKPVRRVLFSYVTRMQMVCGMVQKKKKLVDIIWTQNHCDVTNIKYLNYSFTWNSCFFNEFVCATWIGVCAFVFVHIWIDLNRICYFLRCFLLMMVYYIF